MSPLLELALAGVAGGLFAAGDVGRDDLGADLVGALVAVLDMIGFVHRTLGAASVAAATHQRLEDAVAVFFALGDLGWWPEVRLLGCRRRHVGGFLASRIDRLEPNDDRWLRTTALTPRREERGDHK